MNSTSSHTQAASESLRLLISKLAVAAAQLRFLPRVWHLVRDSSGRFTFFWLALLVIQGLLPVAIVYLTRELIDGVTTVARSATGTIGWPEVAQAFVPAAMMGAVLLLIELLNSLGNWLRTAQARLIEDHVSGLVHRQSTDVDLAFYESPDFHDHLHRARAEAGYRPVALLENFGSLVQNGITLTAMAAVLLPYGIWMSLALVASTIPALVIVLRYALKQHRWQRKTTADERRTSYYDWLMTASEPAAEMRLFDLGAMFRGEYQDIRTRLRKGYLSLAWSRGIAEFSAGAIALLVAAGCLALMMWRAFLGQVTLGEVALFYQAFSQGQRLMRTLLDSIGQAYYNVLFLGNLFEFLDLKSEVRDPANPRALPAAQHADDGEGGMSICFKDVVFRYPGSTRTALSRLNLSIPAGQVVAMVGANGAGKSTLLKLLCRYYDPEAGSVELNGVDIREVEIRELRRRITVLFQEPVHYNASVAQNIALQKTRGDDAEWRAGVVAAAQGAGAEELIARLPASYETLLGKWFAGGVELSVGEWQRLALARAFLRKAPVIVLDEPTSAMDSWAEAEWMARFRRLASGRTSIIITHRFSTAMQADVIHVMDGGAVVESGSHAELVERGGVYAQSWTAQMRAGQPNDG